MHSRSTVAGDRLGEADGNTGRVHQGRAKVVFVNRSYWPDQEATGQLLTDLCCHLAEHFDVHVVCGQPNSTVDGVRYQSSGQELKDGVTIHRLTHATFPKSWPAGRLMNLVTFTQAASRYLKRSRLNADLFVCETDPFLLPPVVARHARRQQTRFLAYLQDIYPDVAIAIGKARDGLLTKQIRKRLRQAYEQADRVVVLGEDMCRRLTDWGLDRRRMEIVPNWVDCEAVQPTPREHNAFLKEHQLEDRFVVMHSGNMGLTQRLDVAIEATKSSHWPEDAVLMLVGGGAMQERLEEHAKSCPPDRVRFLPYQPRETLSQSLSAADLHLVSMDERITGCLFPSKFYGILAAACPVLMIVPEHSEPAQIVRNERIGWTCEPGDPEEIAKSVASARGHVELDTMGQRARRLAEEQYDRSVSCRAFEQIIRGLVTPPSGWDESVDHEDEDSGISVLSHS